jgi:formylmethanofuran dehydrogenase subunit A
MIEWDDLQKRFGFTGAHKAIYNYAYKGIIPPGTEAWNWEEIAEHFDRIQVSLTIAITELIETLNKRQG